MSPIVKASRCLNNKPGKPWLVTWDKAYGDELHCSPRRHHSLSGTDAGYFLQLTVDDISGAKWTADIHREWIDALLRNEPHRDRAALKRTRDRMDQATRDCLVTGYRTPTHALDLPGPGNIHVLAAAIFGHRDVIVACNLPDFPEDTIAPCGIEVLYPDNFLSSHIDLMPGHFCDAVRQIRERLVTSLICVKDYLGTLAAPGLVATAAILARF